MKRVMNLLPALLFSAKALAVYAYASHEQLNIGYDNTGSCADGYIG